MAGLSIETLDDQLLFEQFESFGGGVDMYRRPTIIEPDQFQYGLNVLVRDNLEIRTRPGVDPIQGAGQAVFDSGFVQGLYYFDTPATSQLLAVANQGVYSWNGAVKSTVSGWTPSSALVRVEIAQGVDKALLSDGVGAMQSYDGTTMSALGTTPSDAPVGCSILCWHTQRMFAAGHSTLTDTVWVSNLLNFQNGNWNSTTRSFRVGVGDGDPIVGLFSISGVSGNQFSLAVMKRNSIWITNTDPTQEPGNWSTNQGIARVSHGVGLCGKHAATTYGNDLYFVSPDRQIYSLGRMIAAAGQNQVSAPISQPIQTIIDRINPSAQDKIEVLRYRELILFCVPLDTSTYNNAVLVYNARLQRWVTSYWSGWSPSAITITRFSGVQRLVFGDHSGYVMQWKDNSSVTADATYQDNGANYASETWTRSSQFGDPLARKSGRNCKMRFSAGHSTVSFTAVQDLTATRTASTNLSATGSLLGVGLLGSFILASQKPILVSRGLRGLNRFNELYIKVRSESGWWSLRNMSLAAFPCSFKDNK